MLGRPSESIESAYKEGELSRLKKVVGLQGEEIELLYRELETKDATIRQMRAQHDGLLQVGGPITSAQAPPYNIEDSSILCSIQSVHICCTVIWRGVGVGSSLIYIRV